jgi:hypothetical protein
MIENFEIMSIELIYMLAMFSVPVLLGLALRMSVNFVTRN